ncbi:MAG: hypothetical protein OET79_05410, partial [Nitrospirota bacterium]|nr:hypothetical protein [Nitrospirota bacterium]
MRETLLLVLQLHEFGGQLLRTCGDRLLLAPFAVVLHPQTLFLGLQQGCLKLDLAVPRDGAIALLVQGRRARFGAPQPLHHERVHRQKTRPRRQVERGGPFRLGSLRERLRGRLAPSFQGKGTCEQARHEPIECPFQKTSFVALLPQRHLDPSTTGRQGIDLLFQLLDLLMQRLLQRLTVVQALTKLGQVVVIPGVGAARRRGCPNCHSTHHDDRHQRDDRCWIPSLRHSHHSG